MWRLTSTIAGIAAVWSLVVSAQQTPAPGGRGARDAPPGPVPRTVDGHPDLHGVWLGGGPTSDIADGLQEGEAIPYTALGKKTKESRMAKDDPEANCLPTGVPRQAPYPWRILTTPSGSHMYFLFEGNIHSYRQIFLDGRSHPDGDALNPTWYGHSVGRWEGDTLAVDTTNFTDRTRFRGSSPDLHVVERFTRTGPNTLLYRFTIEDPKTWTRPWTGEYTWPATTEHMYEYACHEGNYALGNILRGARMKESEDAKRKTENKKQ